MKAKGTLLPDYLIDSIGWEASFTNMYFAPYTTYYHSHQAYKDYPTVNISHQAAQAYCQWLTEIVNASANNPIWHFEFRLPSKDLWMAAAQGGDTEAVYAWGSTSLRDARGSKMCNYLEVGDEFISRNSYDNSLEVKNPANRNTLISMPVYSFFSNPFGIFNMNGNVAEMIDQEGIALGGSWYCTGFDVRNQSSMNYQYASPLVGFRPILIVSAKN
jgi:formylglycine-generating enzyme required for sulfatase activity